MKRLLLRSLREIKANITQFISIVLIIAVGSVIFSGLFSTTRILHTFLEDYYKTQKLTDSWLYVSGATNDDIAVWKEKFPELSINPRYSFQTDIVLNGNTVALRFYDEIAVNTPKILSGRDIQSDSEVILDSSFAKNNGFEPGDKVSLTLDGTQYSYTLVGLFESPEFAYKTKDYTGAASDKKTFGILFTTKSNLIELNHHTEIYKTAYADALVKFRDAQATIDSGRSEYQKNLTDFEVSENNANATFAQKQKELTDSQDLLNDGKAQLDAQSASVYQQLNSAIVQVQGGLAQADQSQVQLTQQHAQYLLIRPTLDTDTQIAQDAYFANLQTTLTGQITVLNQQLAGLNAQLASAKSTFDSKYAEIAANQTKLTAGQSLLTRSKNETAAKFASARKLLAEAKTKLDDGQAELNTSKADAMAKIENIPSLYFEILIKGNVSAITKTYFENEKLTAGWIDQADFPGVSMVLNVLAPIETMSSIFPILFFLVAAIIILISMSRTVDNDRMQIAIMQGLGISKLTIASSYLFYGWWASIFGSIIFALLGNIFLPIVLLNIFTTRFSIPSIPIFLYPEYIFVTLGLALFFSTAAILMALRGVLKERPAQSMRPKPPKSSKRSFIEHIPFIWRRLAYSQKLIVRNFMMGKIRLLLSSIGILGATTLLITGLSLNQSATSMMNNTIKSYNYQYSIHLTEAVENANGFIFPYEFETVEQTKNIVTKLNDESNTSVVLTLLEVDEKLIVLVDKNLKRIPISSDSVVIPISMAIQEKLKIGDSVELKIGDDVKSLTITDIDNQYLGRTMYISYDLAKTLNYSTASDTVLVQNITKKTNLDEVAMLLKTAGVKSVDTIGNIVDRSREILKMLSGIIMMIVISAAILCMTVIYNIASINIFERQRELATLRVLGYYVNEVEKLVFVENVVLATLGSLGGVPAGIFLFKYIAQLVSSKDFMMSEQVSIPIVLAAVGMTYFFTMITNLVLKQKIKRIQLVESLKGVE